MKLALGQIVEATRDTGVCKVGERGVVYELYAPFEDRGKPAHARDDVAASIIFETGGYDGFSPGDQRLMLKALDLRDEANRSYKFINVGILSQDYRAGRFNFHPEDK